MEDTVIAKLLKPGDRSFTAESVRLIGLEGEQLEIVSLAKARELAHQAGYDLVLVSDRAVPPVVRIMDFGKLQYEQKKNLKNQRKNQLVQKIKEVKFHVNTDSNDYNYKVKRAVEFLCKGNKVKLTLTLRGREMDHKDLAFALMERLLADLAEMGDADGKPKMLGKNISVILAPSKNCKRVADERIANGLDSDEFEDDLGDDVDDDFDDDSDEDGGED